MPHENDAFRPLVEAMRAEMNHYMVAWAKENTPTLPIGDVFKLASEAASVAASHMDSGRRRASFQAFRPRTEIGD